MTTSTDRFMAAVVAKNNAAEVAPTTADRTIKLTLNLSQDEFGALIATLSNCATGPGHGPSEAERVHCKPLLDRVLEARESAFT